MLTQSLETEDSPPLGLTEYEQLKTWLFTQIEQGELTQVVFDGRQANQPEGKKLITDEITPSETP